MADLIFWRKEDPIIDENGVVVVGGMFPHQRTWWNLPNFIKAMVAGYGSGKTFIGGKYAIARSLLNDPAPFLCVSPTYKMSKRTLIPAIHELLEGKKTLDRDLSYKYNKSDFEFIIKHRGRIGKIWCMSGENPDSLKGPNIGAALIDEPFIQDKEVFEQVLARVRHPRAKIKDIGLTGTPEELNWGYDICEGAEADNFDLGMLHAGTAENLALGPDYVQRLRRAYTDKMVDAYLDGAFVNLSRGAIYYGFTPDINVIDLEDPGHELEVGMDFNVDPMAAIVFWRASNHMHVVDEIEIENADTQYMCDYLKDTFKWRDGTCRIQNVYPDASGKKRTSNAPGGVSDFKILQNAGFQLYSKRANPPIRDRENAVNGKLRPHVGPASLTMSSRCKKLKQYLMQYTHEKRQKQKQMSHLIDALGYPIAFIWPYYRPSVKQIQLVGH